MFCKENMVLNFGIKAFRYTNCVQGLDLDFFHHKYINIKKKIITIFKSDSESKVYNIIKKISSNDFIIKIYIRKKEVSLFWSHVHLR